MAQQESDLLNHDFIGTEHLLLGLAHEGEGVAARALEQLGLSLEGLRAKVEEAVPPRTRLRSGSPPFTSRAKRVLELSLREALNLGHNYIGTEHQLLGLLREGEGVAAQVLVSLGVDLDQVSQTVIQLLSGPRPSPEEGSRRADTIQVLRSPLAKELAPNEAQLVACSFCDRRPSESGRFVQGRRAFICEHCIGEWGQRPAEDEGQGEEEGPGARLWEPEHEGGESEGGEDEG